MAKTIRHDLVTMWYLMLTIMIPMIHDSGDDAGVIWGQMMLQLLLLILVEWKEVEVVALRLVSVTLLT
jgi:hypothetical protein